MLADSGYPIGVYREKDEADENGSGGNECGIFARFNMVGKFLMQLKTDKALFIDFRGPRVFGRLETGREFVKIRLFSRHQRHVTLAAPKPQAHERLPLKLSTTEEGDWEG